MSTGYSLRLELEMASYIVRNPQVTARIIGIIGTDSDLKGDNVNLFYNKLLSILIKTYLAKAKELKCSLLTQGQWEQAVNQDPRLPSNYHSKASQMIQEILKIEIADKKIASEYLSNHLVKKKTLHFMQSNQDTMVNDPAKFQENLLAFSEECQKINVRANTKVVFNSLVDIISQYADDSNGNIKIGIPMFDDYLHGGIGRQELTVVMSPTNAGKSYTIANIISFIAKTFDLRGILFSLEGKSLQYPMRIGCCMAGMSYNRILRYRQQEHKEKKIEKFFSKEEIAKCKAIESFHDESRLVIYHQITDPYIESMLEIIRAEYQNKRLDYFIIDYIQITQTNLKFSRRDEEIGYIMRKSEALASELNMAGIIVSQVKTSASSEMYHEFNNGEMYPIPKLESAGEGKKITDTPATVIAIARTPEERKSGAMRYAILKSRESGTEFQVQVMPKWEFSDIFGGKVTFSGFSDGRQNDNKKKNADTAMSLVERTSTLNRDLIKESLLRFGDYVLISQNIGKLVEGDKDFIQSANLLSIRRDYLEDLAEIGKVSEIQKKLESDIISYLSIVDAENFSAVTGLAGAIDRKGSESRGIVYHKDLLFSRPEGQTQDLKGLLLDKFADISELLSNYKYLYEQ